MTPKTLALEEPRIGSFEDLSKGRRLKAIKQIPVRPMEPLTDGIIIRRMEKVERGIDPAYENFLSAELDQTKEYPDPIPVLSLKQDDKTVPFFSEGSISLIHGKQKSKKTTFLALAVAAYISPTNDNPKFQKGSDGVVLYFDTEQGTSYAARTMRLILNLSAEKTSDRLRFLNLRKYTQAERMDMIKAGIQNTPNVKLVVIDGLIDLLVDWREPAENQLLIAELLRLSEVYQIHIICVLHQNKTDKNAREIIGTIMTQKSETVVSIERDSKDKSRSIVDSADNRNLPFRAFAIRWDEGCLPFIEDDFISTTTDSRVDKKINDLLVLVQNAFKKDLLKLDQSYRRVDAIDAIMKVSGLEERQAGDKLKAMVNNGLATKTGEKQNTRYQFYNGLICVK